jgi:cytochrome c peroxidase
VSLLAVVFAATGCDNFNATPVEFGQDDIVTVGDIRTLEIRQRVIASLPESKPTLSRATVELGRLLFWDPVLSGDQDVACATCHLPEHAYTDNQARAIGVSGSGRGADRLVGGMDQVKRNSQSVLNTHWNGINELGVFDPSTAPMFWDNRTVSLQAQALEPLKSREEMRGDAFTENEILTEIEARLNTISEYRELFSSVFGTQQITITEVAEALATFQSSLVANNTPFDRWMRGVADAMTEREISGMQEFVIAGCADCHSGPLFSDFQTRILGVEEGAGLPAPDDGDGSFAFRTPSLRQLNFTAPYFHAGQFATLGAAIDFYDEPGGSRNPNVPSSAIDPELLEVPEMDDGRGSIIAAFLNALNDPDFDQQEPERVPSGLPPGGFSQ